MYARYIKRMLDIIFSFCGIIVLSPVLLVLFIMVRVKLGTPAIFKQKRIGMNEKVFTICKFRTMTDKKDENGNVLPDEDRVTKFGSFLRSTSLDELPEIFNILKGDLSIVGPRSLLPDYLPYYTDEERKRHNVRGGLTPPEVLYDNVTPTWEDQFKYEVDYANNVSLILDIKIIFATVRGVLKRNDIDYGHYVRKSLIEERQQKETIGVSE